MTSTSLGGEAWCAGEILGLALRAYCMYRFSGGRLRGSECVRIAKKV